MTSRGSDTVFVSRRNFTISPRGTYGACLSAGGGKLAVERWPLAGGHPQLGRSWTATVAIAETQPTVSDHGALFLTTPIADCCELTHVDPVLGQRSLGRFERTGLHLLASPGWDHAVALGFGHRDGRTRLWRISGSPPSLSEVVVDAPGLLRVGGWLDRGGTLLAVNQTVGDRSGVRVIDLAAGSLSQWHIPSAHLILVRPGSGELLVAAEGERGAELALVSQHCARRVLDGLRKLPGAVLPLAFDPAGDRLVLGVTRGVRSHLFEYDLAADRAREVPMSPGVIRSPAVWSSHGLHLTFSAPECPTRFATLRGRPLSWEDPEPLQPVVGAHSEWLQGASGPLEAVIYGGPDWRYSERLVIAIHGGPEASWQLDFEPLFQRLAAAGVAVAAPNQRGSTGYGSAHRLAIKDAWGGPDLADIAEIGRNLAALREGAGLQPAMLYGTSYGGFLALLCASCDPVTWSRCVAVSAFLSGPRLHADGSPPVRRFVERLGGRTPINDELGSRDVASLCASMRAPLLLIHGERDRLVPVSHARQLRDRLLVHGRRTGTDFSYLEIPGAGHSPLDGTAGPEVSEEIVRFLTADVQPDVGFRAAIGG